MSRQDDLDRFYTMLDLVKGRAGGYRRLKDCTGDTGWPARGVYFFFEEGELREDHKSLRVVRVGTHALTDTSKTTLWSRLRTHRGQGDGRGNHRGSIFRKRVGLAILNRSAGAIGQHHPTWGEGQTAPRRIRDGEVFLERQVSNWIGQLPFLCVRVDDMPGKASSRGFLEKNCIGLLSNFSKAPIDPPSPGWLGRFSDKREIRESGLWNSDHVDADYDPHFLDRLSSFL